MKKSLLVFSLIFSAIGINSFAKGYELRILSKFEKEANNKNSELNQIIKKINDDTVDGRNSEGAIKFPIKKSDLKIIKLGEETITNPWHYGDKNEAGNKCSANKTSMDYLILLNSHYRVHMAYVDESIPFTVRLTENLVATKKDGSKIENCGEVAYDEKGEYNVTSDKTIIEKFIPSTLSEKERQ